MNLAQHLNKVRNDIHRPPETGQTSSRGAPPDATGRGQLHTQTTDGTHTRPHFDDTDTDDTDDTGTDTDGTPELSLTTEIRLDHRQIIVLDSEVERRLHQLLTAQ